MLPLELSEPSESWFNLLRHCNFTSSLALLSLVLCCHVTTPCSSGICPGWCSAVVSARDQASAMPGAAVLTSTSGMSLLMITSLAPAWEWSGEGENQCTSFNCAVAGSEAGWMKDLDRNQVKHWYEGLLQNSGVNDVLARKSKWDLRQCYTLYGMFVRYGWGEWSFYVIVFPYGPTVMRGTTLAFVVCMEG